MYLIAGISPVFEYERSIGAGFRLNEELTRDLISENG
jgi:hypothetical protein